MIETAPTLGSVETSTAKKRQYARESLAYNVRDAKFCKLFPEYVEQYNANKQEGVENGSSHALFDSTTGGLLRNDRPEMLGLLAPVAGLFAILSIVLAMRFF